MCFLAVLYRAVPDCPLVVAANRDEFRDRPGLPPGALAPGIWGGRDPRAGGTWLGVNARGLVAAVANILDGSPPLVTAKAVAVAGNPAARSRGVLCLDALGLRGAADFPAFLRGRLRADAFDPFNLVVADSSSGWVASFVGGRLTLSPLVPGLHVIGNSPPRAEGDLKVTAGRRLISVSNDLPVTLESLQAACRFHGDRGDHADAICIHGRSHGTLSSSLLVLHEGFPRRGLYLYADGPPCTAPYEDHSSLFLSHAPGSIR